MAGLFSRLRKRKQATEQILGIIEEAMHGAARLADVRDRLAQRVAQGDLDSAIAMLSQARYKAELYVNEGR